MQSDHPRGRSALYVLAVLAIALLVIHRADDSNIMHYSAAVEACSTLPGRAAQLCSSYHLATGQAKFDAAVHWRQLNPASCECSGLLVQPASRLMLAYTRCARLAPSRGMGPDCSTILPLAGSCALQMLARALLWIACRMTCTAAAAAAVVHPCRRETRAMRSSS